MAMKPKPKPSKPGKGGYIAAKRAASKATTSRTSARRTSARKTTRRK